MPPAEPLDVRAAQGRADVRLFLRVLPILLAATVYFVKPLLRDEHRPDGRYAQLAQALVHGRITIESEPERAGELIPSNDVGLYYCPYPPLPALILTPLVAMGGSAIRVEWACRVISVLNVAVFSLMLDRLFRWLRLPRPGNAAAFALALLFAFGTAVWHNADMAGDWHLAHAVALLAMLLALFEHAGKDRPLLAGLLVALAAGARPTAALTGLFFLLSHARRPNARRALIQFAIAPVAAAGLLLAYNAARWGRPFDFGYDRMILDEHGSRLLLTYGQFNIQFVPRNFFWFFLAPPWPSSRTGLPAFDPRGMSLFVTTPALLYALAALRRFRSDTLVRDAALAIVPCLALLLMYFNTGYYQFGHRFVLDYLPMLLLLLVIRLGPRPCKLTYAFICASVAINAWGILLATATRIPITLLG